MNNEYKMKPWRLQIAEDVTASRRETTYYEGMVRSESSVQFKPNYNPDLTEYYWLVSQARTAAKNHMRRPRVVATKIDKIAAD